MSNNAAASCHVVTTTFESVQRPDPLNERDWTWGEFVEFIERNGHTRTNDRDADVPLFGNYRLKPGTKSANANVDAVYCWTLDLDKLPQEKIDDLLERLLEEELAFLVYSTHKHTPDAPRLRVLGPLSRPVQGKDWRPIWRAIVDKYSPGADEQCKDVRRLYYYPSAKPDAEAVLFSSPGRALEPPSVVSVAAGPHTDLDAKELIDSGFRLTRCPNTVSAFTHGERLCREMPAAVQGQGGSIALLRVARALVWGLDLEPRQAADLIGEIYNPRCSPPWSETEIAHKVDDAGNEAGAPYARGALKPIPPSTPALELATDMVDAMSLMHRTDAGNAERFALMHHERARYCPPRKRWLVWDDKRWAWDERETVWELAKQTARAIWKEIDTFGPDSTERKQAAKNAIYAESRQGLSNMLALAGPLCAVLPAELDSDSYAFNVQNGTIDLRTGELRPHRRDDLITKISPIDYDSSATSELWDDCLLKFTDGDAELSGYLRRAIGYALIGQVVEKCFWFAFGPPNGGKSTFIAAIARAFGDYAVATDADTWLRRRDVGGNRGDVVRLLGSRLVTCVEFQKGSRFDEKLIKGVTGGDAMTAAGKYEHEVTFLPQFALWLAANDAPTIHDDDEGMWSRVRRVPFTTGIPLAEQDRTVRSRIQEPKHAQAVLAWAVRGCLEWQKHGLGTCAAIDASNQAYRQEMDRCAPFFEELCEFRADLQMPAGTLRQRYEEWCKDRRVRPISPRDFAAKLRERGCEPVKDSIMKWIGVRTI